MPLLKPDLSGIEYDAWIRQPRMERIKPLIRAWGEAGFGTPDAIYLIYFAKIFAYAVGAVWLASLTTPGLGTLGDLPNWWLEPIVWQKVVIVTLLFEVIGLGCGFGPLTFRFLPPIGGFLFWLRPGTIRQPPWPDLVPLTRGTRRQLFDVLLYASVLAAGVWALLSPTTAPDPGLAPARLGMMEAQRVLPLLGLLCLMGLRDKTIFLAARSEVYLMFALTALLSSTDWVFAAKLGMLLLWWGAAFSKINRHFPFVIATMQSNHPLLRLPFIKRRNYRSFPDDMLPSPLTVFLGHAATVFEIVMPVLLIVPLPASIQTPLVVIFFLFHLHIMFALPMGVPLEWNVFMMYSLVLLFGAYDHVTLTGSLGNIFALVGFGIGAAIVTLGNLYPEKFSFLLSMRYYAGNWATSMWVLKPSAFDKIRAEVVGWTGTPEEQLTRIYGAETAAILAHKGYVFRALHSHGRALFTLAEAAAGPEHETSHVFLDGEFIAGAAIGWNFGEGHLHDEQLMGALQERCGFEPGEVRAVLLEGQPFHLSIQRFRVVDAASGELLRGEVDVSELVERQPWDTAVPYRVTGGDASALQEGLA